ncbi:MAG TPA: hypothetical protein VFH56_01550 [Acidimicrobiales bacterium]|nr:hypothetical protein [Acidimicrobiales bacterium]
MYTVADLWDVARNAGFSPAQSVIAVAISLAEDSQMNPNATNHNANGTVDHGAWQINDANSDIIAKYGNPYNLQDNARMAYAVYRRQGWRAWSTYNSGAYKAHLPEAKAVAKQKGASLPTGVWDSLTNPVGTIGSLVKNGSLPVSSSPFAGLSAIGDLAGHLMDSGLWKRIGIAALAILIIIVGVVLMVESNHDARRVTEMAALA